MSKVYYIGKLYSNDSKDKQIFKNLYVTQEIAPYCLDIEKLKLSRVDFNYLKNFLNEFDNYYAIITEEKIIEIIKKANLPGYRTIDKTPIFIFEIVKDVDGYSYGREIITQYLFPFCDNMNLSFRYNYNDDYKLGRIYSYENPKMAKFSYAFDCCEVATQNQVNEYIVKNTKKSKIDKHNKLVTKYYNENVFKEKIILKEDRELEKQNELTKLMENIEFLLSLIKQIDKNLYNDFSKKYNSMCSENNLTMPQKSDFVRLLSNIKFHLSLKKNNIKDINEYLNTYIESYFNKLINKIELKEKLNIIDIDNLVELILKNKDEYSINTQRKYLIKISLLYLLVIKNLDNINEDNLKNGYFKDNIRTILYNIITLKDLGIIFDEFELNELTDTSITNVLNLIKKMDFDKANKEKIKLLIKEK